MELRSLNHRYFDLSCRFPGDWPATEDRLRALVQARVNRGKVTACLTWRPAAGAEAEVAVDERAAREYVRKTNQLARRLGVPGKATLEQLTAHPEIVCVTRKDGSREEPSWSVVRKAAEQALGRLQSSRVREGRQIRDELLSQIRVIEGALGKVSHRMPVVLDQYRRRLTRVAREVQGSKRGALDKSRLDAEVLNYARSSDVREELVRAKSHLAHLRGLLTKANQDRCVGRELDFTAQELQREVNTIGQKTSDYSISRAVIRVKSAVERIREQVQNVE